MSAQNVVNKPTASAAPNVSSDTLGSSTDSTYYVQTTNTNSPSPAGRSAAVLRFALQAKARELLPDHRVGWCMRRFRAERKRVGIVQAKARGSAYFNGLMRCGRVWVCPVCASKISETRRTELNELLLASREIVLSYNGGELAKDENGKTVYVGGKPEYYPRWFLTMLTYTMQHKANESADAVLARLDRAWARYWSGEWAQQFRKRFYIVGTLRALEMTHGAEGWHPHYHMLQFHDSYLREQIGWLGNDYAPSQPEMIGVSRVRWSQSALKTGGYADPTIGVALSVGEIAKYPIKSDAEKELKRWGMTSEVTKQTVKRGKRENRSMTDLLIDAAKGDDLASKLWTEGTAALEGHKQLEPSKGLWAMLGRKLKSEEEAAEDEAQASDVVLAELTWLQWRKVLEADVRGEVLDIASRGDVNELWAYLNTIGVYDDPEI